MKLRARKGWKSLISHRVRSKSADGFRLFSKVKPEGYGHGAGNSTPVFLNIYDLTPAVNGFVYWAGIGIFHSGLEVYGVEYAFGAHDYPSSGIFEVEPRQCPGFKFRRSISVGRTSLDPLQMREFMHRQSTNYHGDSYHLITKNCNHFCEDICFKLTGNHIPKWVNRLAKIGLICNCVLPESLKVSRVRYDPNPQAHAWEAKSKRLTTSAFGFLSSISLHQKKVSMSSLFLHVHYRGCLPPWELKRSKSCLLKKD